MTRDKSPRAIAVRAVAQKSLEAYAAKILDPDTVLGAVTKAAADGFFCLRVAPDVACDLRGTKAAAVIAELLKREGFEHQWEGRISMRKENPSGCEVMVFDLLVSW